MDSKGIVLELFATEIFSVLPTETWAKEEIKKIKSSVVSEPLWDTVFQCLSSFYQSSNTIELKDVLSKSQAIIDITWEKLNTGHWEDVDLDWRYMYSYGSLCKVLCLLLDKNSNKKDVIKACDMGLLMGAPICNNILSSIAQIITTQMREFEENPDRKNKKQKSEHCNFPSIKAELSIPEEVCPSCDAFKSNFMDKKKPVVLKNVIDFWPSLSSRKWCLDYLLKVACYRTVPVEIGSKYTESNWTQKLMLFQEFVKDYIWNEDKNMEIGYLAQHQLFDQIPQLRKDFSIPTYCCLTDEPDDKIDVDISAWFGPASTVSPLHYDPKHNLLAQVMGEKYIRLYSESVSHLLYPTDSRLLHNTSQIDVENPDYEKFPLFATAPYLECILRPGDLLYIPPRCWHYVKSLSISFSISFWWQ